MYKLELEFKINNYRKITLMDLRVKWKGCMSKNGVVSYGLSIWNGSSADLDLINNSLITLSHVKQIL